MMFGVTPEALNAVDVRFPTSKIVLMMEDSVVVVAVQNEAVVDLPAIRPGFPLNNGNQLFFRTTRNYHHKHFPGSPNTGVSPAAPHPLLPQTRRAPK